jgi:hypothetical protein
VVFELDKFVNVDAKNAIGTFNAVVGMGRDSDAASCTRARIWKGYGILFAALTFGMRG